MSVASAVPPSDSLLSLWRGFKGATLLGWSISSNWTRPFVFLIYTVLRPISGALILVVMYRFITGNRTSTTAYLAFLVTGIAFWGLVQNTLAGLANGISEDRGFYRMLKYAYVSPLPFPLYLVGRGLAQLGLGVISAATVLVLATVALQLPIDPLHVNYLMLVLASAIAMVAVMGIALTYGLLLLNTRDSHGYGEIGAQVLYIGSGAIFPITVLPHPLAVIASVSPLVYWMELIRRSLLGPHALQMFAGLSDGAILGRLVLTAAATVILTAFAFRWANQRARARGLIDMEINW